ncbi:ABC-2 transporter permease [Paenibacillus glacialis]|uniref:ABC transporter permease n=1 Tax=Paenibacillus glacialis TaxID=494026 RepID=A0A162PK68_9BACL|nr:ABC-2 transporter permease [Paenibacillus glacialis]OAB32980.1 ABC transporter permease [Paenibacillus glacialis]
MLNLLRKDFIALKSSLWLGILFLAVFSAFFIPKLSTSIHLVGIYTAFALLNHGTMIDIKNNNHNFLLTLPIKRKHIVQAKYITAIIYTLFGVLASYGIHWLVKKLAILDLNMPDYSVLDILVPAGIVLVLTSIYLPLFYTLSKKGTSIINVVFFLCLIALANPTALFMNMINEKGFSSDQTLFLILTGIILLFIASYYLTINLFTRKDL